MTIKEFLSDRLGSIFSHFLAAALLAVFLLLTSTAGGIVSLVLLIWVLVLSVKLVVQYYREKQYLDTLEGIMSGLKQRYLFAQCLPEPRTNYERCIFRLVRLAGKGMIEEVSLARTQQSEYREYIESWVHEVKAPITAIQLICQNRSSMAPERITRQVKQIEEHVERALYYARLGNVEKDFLVRETALQDIITAAIKKQQVLLIQNGVSIETDDIDQLVYTDAKWVSFMISQLLLNAIRYRQERPVIRIAAKALGSSVVLTVEDNGIGISADEQPRIFDRGFTGSNGRSRGGSTGMGLYICRRLAEALQIQLDVDSREGQYTRLSMTFPAKSYLTKT